ncbi:unnamed protein product, partial [Gongylonema pulchrum]|uniref:Uncharacterized protein n=1 Tax=Gongylonema pulchrum TaxID=637853 RepID=A0A183DKX6_9BILA
MVNNTSQVGIKEVASSDGRNIEFSTSATAVPKFMKLSDEVVKYLTDGSSIIADKFANSKRSKSTEADAENGNLRRSETNIGAMQMSEGENYAENNSVDEDERVVGETTTQDDGNVRDENGAIITDPRMAYFKKFEKFFDFLQTTIKKVAKIVKEGQENNKERMKSLVKDINIIWRPNATMDSTTNSGLSGLLTNFGLKEPEIGGTVASQSIAVNEPRNASKTVTILSAAGQAILPEKPSENGMGNTTTQSLKHQTKNYNNDTLGSSQRTATVQSQRSETNKLRFGSDEDLAFQKDREA